MGFIMKVGVLAIASHDSGGIHQYTLSLLEALKLINKDNIEFVQIRNQDFPKILTNDIVINKKKSTIFLKFKRALHGILNVKIGNLTKDLDNESLLEISKIDLLISPVITLIPHHFGKPYIVTLHDFQQEYYPEFFTFKERMTRKIVYRTGKYAKFVVVESLYVKRDVIRFLKISDLKIKVIPSPPPFYLREITITAERLLSIKMKYDLVDRYLFYPAQFWYHKNHLKLIEAIHLLREKYHIIIPLILVGSKKNNFGDVMKKIKELGLVEQVKYLGYVPDEDMPYLYKLATALVMPTLFESVSLPIWEAFYLGCPVVSSNVCALPEQVGDAGLLFNPYNVNDMAEKIYKILTDEGLRKDLIQRGYERVKDLTLENYANQWEKVIEEALNRADRL